MLDAPLPIASPVGDEEKGPRNSHFCRQEQSQNERRRIAFSAINAWHPIQSGPETIQTRLVRHEPTAKGQKDRIEARRKEILAKISMYENLIRDYTESNKPQ